MSKLVSENPKSRQKILNKQLENTVISISSVLMKKIIKEYTKETDMKLPVYRIQEIDIEYSGSSIRKVRRCELEIAEHIG